MDEVDQKKVFFPTVQFIGAKKVERIIDCGPNTNNNFFWFLYPKLLDYQLYPNMLEYQQALKITIYCSFDFQAYPFDSHDCNFDFGLKEVESYRIKMNSTRIRYQKYKKELGEGVLSMNKSSLPFDILLESSEPYDHFQAAFEYSAARMIIHLSRNNFDQLIGSYYGPTFLFPLLSLVSYTISTDVVS